VRRGGVMAWYYAYPHLYSKSITFPDRYQWPASGFPWTSTLKDSGMRHRSCVRLDDVLVDLGASADGRPTSQSAFLQDVRGGHRLRAPTLPSRRNAGHRTVALPPRGLLRDQTVRSGGTCVILVVHQMVQFEHVHVTHRGRRSKVSPVRPSLRNIWPDRGMPPVPACP